MSEYWEILPRDITDSTVLGRAMTRHRARMRAREIATKRGESVRVIKRRDVYRDATLRETESWTVRPGEEA